MANVRRTSLNLDFELVERAKQALGTKGTTETVHQALEEVWRREALRSSSPSGASSIDRHRAVPERGVGARRVHVELADTSAWTNRPPRPGRRGGVRARRSVDGRSRRARLCGSNSCRATRDAAEFAASRASLDTLRHVAVGPREWRRAEDVFFELAELGPLHHRQVTLPDLLVAAAAERAEIPVLHYDRDFELIASVTGQPVRAIAPLGSL